MKNILLKLLFILISSTSFAQQLYDPNGRISFFSKAPLEDITAVSKKAQLVWDTKTNVAQVKIPIKSFVFEKQLMQEHFNENYLESDQYPYGTFNGNVENIPSDFLEKDGLYKGVVKGSLSIHGESQPMESPITVAVKNGKVALNTVFKILLKDYNIKIPTIVGNKIAKEIEITVNGAMAVR